MKAGLPQLFDACLALQNRFAFYERANPLAAGAMVTGAANALASNLVDGSSQRGTHPGHLRSRLGCRMGAVSLEPYFCEWGLL